MDIKSIPPKNRPKIIKSGKNKNSLHFSVEYSQALKQLGLTPSAQWHLILIEAIGKEKAEKKLIEYTSRTTRWRINKQLKERGLI